MYALDARTVLRRYRRREVPAREVAVMRYVREHGYPAPEILRVDGADLVLERASGTTMREDLGRRPRTIARHARLTADLHPENILLHEKGALVIDWANARAGHWADDVAQTVVILAAADLDLATRALARAFLARYLVGFDRDEVRAHLPAAIARRMADPNMTARERERIPRVRI